MKRGRDERKGGEGGRGVKKQRGKRIGSRKKQKI